MFCVISQPVVHSQLFPLASQEIHRFFFLMESESLLQELAACLCAEPN